MGYVCPFFLSEAKIPDRVTTGGVHGMPLYFGLSQVECIGYACFFFLTEAKIPDRVATCNSGGVHGVCLSIFSVRGQNS